MPTAGNTQRKIRMDDPLWDACDAKAKRTLTNVSAVTRKLLTTWVKEEELTEEDYERLQAELDALNYSDTLWTPEDLARQMEIVAILAKADRL